MARYIDADELIKILGIDGATKCGSKDTEQRNISYSTYMAYEIMDAINDCIDESLYDYHVEGGGKE